MKVKELISSLQVVADDATIFVDIEIPHPEFDGQVLSVEDLVLEGFIYGSGNAIFFQAKKEKADDKAEI